MLVWSESRSVVSDSLRPHGLYSPWNSPGQNTGVCSLSLLQGIFPTQGLNPDLLHCWWILYQLSHKGSPRILEWVAYPFSNGSSRPRNWTGVFWIAGGFFTNWTIREAWEANIKPPCLWEHWRGTPLNYFFSGKNLDVKQSAVMLGEWFKDSSQYYKSLPVNFDRKIQNFRIRA